MLIHPNTNNSLLDHTELATWMGKPWPLYTDILAPEARFGLNAKKKSENQTQQPS